MDRLPLQILLQVILIALNAVFASAEIAVISFNDIKLQKAADDGDKRAKKLVKLTAEPTNFLGTIQVLSLIHIEMGIRDSCTPCAEWR